MKLLAGILICLCVWPVVGFAETPSEEEHSDQEIAEFFETVVFGREFKSPGQAPKQSLLQKWQKPIGIAIQPLGVTLDPVRLKVLESYVRKIAGMVKAVRFGFVKPDDPRATVNIIFAKRELMASLNIEGVPKSYLERLSLTGGCYFLTWAKAGVIERGIVVINAERTVHGMDHCMLEELTQVMGLVNDSDALRPSLFSDRDQMTTFSRTDEILLRVLYDARLKPGMTKAEAMPIATELIQAWNRRLPPP